MSWRMVWMSCSGITWIGHGRTSGLRRRVIRVIRGSNSEGAFDDMCDLLRVRSSACLGFSSAEWAFALQLGLLVLSVDHHIGSMLHDNVHLAD